MIKHSEEFKQEAVRIALTNGLSRRRVASDFGVGLSTLGLSQILKIQKHGWRSINLC